MPPPIIAEGTGYVLFAYDVAHAFDLAAAERRLASATPRQTVPPRRLRRRLRGVPDRGVQRAAGGVHAVDRACADGGSGAARRVTPPVAAGSERCARVAPLVRAERRDADRHRRDAAVRSGG